jgi:hypothetical protein
VRVRWQPEAVSEHFGLSGTNDRNASRDDITGQQPKSGDFNHADIHSFLILSTCSLSIVVEL